MREEEAEPHLLCGPHGPLPHSAGSHLPSDQGQCEPPKDRCWPGSQEAKVKDDRGHLPGTLQVSSVAPPKRTVLSGGHPEGFPLGKGISQRHSQDAGLGKLLGCLWGFLRLQCIPRRLGGVSIAFLGGAGPEV